MVCTGAQADAISSAICMLYPVVFISLRVVCTCGCVSDVPQDSKLPSLFPHRYYLDIVDDEWIADSLSDDEIEVPPGAELDPNNSENPSGELPAWDADGKVDRWTDLGLDLWAKDA